MRLKISEIVKAAGGKLHAAIEHGSDGLSTDSRTVKTGVMFVPIPGEKTDICLH